MTHSEFVQAYKSGRIEIAVNKKLATDLMSNPLMPRRYRFAFNFWFWVAILSIPLAIILGIFVQWWVGVLCFIVGLMIFPAIQKSATQHVIDHAIEDSSFYEIATNELVANRLMIIKEINPSSSD